MAKEYIKDGCGHVSLCASNVARMNMLEAMYYHRIKVLENIMETIDDIKENWYIIINIFIIFTLPVTYPIMIWWEIHKAKKEVKRFMDSISKVKRV